MPKKTTTSTPKKKTTTSRKKSIPKEITLIKHVLVPEHSKLTEKERETLFIKYDISLKEIPKISITDAAIRHLDPKENDIIMIKRKSPTAGESIFYRGVINE
ncbi:DNA-directed RNA polymerase subunit H [Candidatus Woesearchaeota archaeon]|nr:DNA-directed RNA polymerase subunit H [Candidatus Woesearchaeota archaeon]MCF8013660.1 DNA-directed RNA polymerase subunit H [Candidatus Woesearchaeota archaeon]